MSVASTDRPGGRTKPLVVCSRSRSLSLRSGYDLVARHLDADEIVTPRGDPTGTPRKAVARALRLGAASRWYQGSSAAAEWRAFRCLRHNPPPVLHYLWADCDLGYLPWITGWLSPATKLVGTLHNPPTFLHTVMRFPNILTRFDALVLMSTNQREYLIERGIAADRLHVIPHGVDTEFFHCASRGAARTFRVLSVGSYLRNFDLLREVCIACASRSDIEFEIIGPAALSAQFADLPNVRLRHGLSDDKLAAAYREASCLLLTLLDSTANNSLLEAMASGLPIIAENIGGTPDYVNVDSAMICPPKSVRELTEAISRLADDPDLAVALGQAARQQAEALSWPSIGQRTLALYEALQPSSF